VKVILENIGYLVKISLLFLLLVFAKGCETVKEAHGLEADHQPILLLISIDGFAFDYFDKAETPTFDSLIDVGVKAEALIPVFPSKTFPNHYTQVTGLYPENHGITSNRMYDVAFDQYFSIGAESTTTGDGKWYQGEPIWVTARNQGLTTATMFWPGSDAEIKGVRPNYYFPYNGAIAPEDRIEQVLMWMQVGRFRPQLITLYFEQVDQVGHLHGPNSPAVESAIRAVDGYLEKLMQSITLLGFADQVNIIIVSDHGMATKSRERMIFLDDYIDLAMVEVVNWSPVAELIPVSGKEAELYDQLVEVHPHLQVYRKGALPKRWHFNHHPRITPIVAVADVGWSIGSREYFKAHPKAYKGGTHGYDPAAPAMQGIFIATGPSFQSGVNIGAVEAVHLYELMCALLGLHPAENDGKLDVWDGVLK